ncbi:MAG: glycoside hydrolase family 55 protein [Pseudomonadota bacterium]|nr:glycoside hydrolase family 55 protein [Pseudomonadota bacterium]
MSALVNLLAFLSVVADLSTGPAPVLYHRAAYESPVSGDPDDLLLLAGYGFAADDVVVYRAIADTTRHSTAPSHVPAHSSPDFGLASVVGNADVPYSLTVKLPPLLRADQTYALWVRTARGAWSESVKINDARPLWISPAYVYASGSPAFLPRELKIVGRNLQPAPGQSTQIRLIGPQRFIGNAAVDAQSSGPLDHYVARLRLPTHLAPGNYAIQVNRDGSSWMNLDDQSLEVVPDRPRIGEFSVGDSQFGGCRPDDGVDDTPCIVRAISAATRAGGGIVSFGPGTWDLIDGTPGGSVAGEGILVPAGVQLQGAGSAVTRIQRHAEWNSQAATAAFTLVGHTLVTGFTFRDLQIYRPGDHAGPFLHLGEGDPRTVSASGRPSSATVVSDITITRNVFDKPWVAVGSGELPIERLFITYNTFGAYLSALELSGDKYNVNHAYRIDDSVIDYNVFKPGSMLDLTAKTGTMASELGAGHRVDFSHNSADGSSTEYLYSADDAKGWRAAFFWNLNNNVQEVLVSQNTATCTGDKIGDGEAIAFDNNINTFGFDGAPTVSGATAGGITLKASFAPRQFDRVVPSERYYVGHWVRIVNGPGIGQVRRITGYSENADTHLTTIHVAPDWDVAPAPDRSRVSVGREYRQLYVVDNHVDNRKPLCQKANRSRRVAGSIEMWGQSADSVFAGNHQYDSDGILVQQSYETPEHPCAGCTMQGFFNSFLEIRGNVIDGEYDWTNDCSSSGITIGIAAAPWEATPPPTVGFGVSISHNTIRHADGQSGGAISQVSTWYAGPGPHRWPLSNNLLIFHNSIADIDGARAIARCGKSHPRIGIAFPDPAIAWRTVLYANSCKNVSMPVGPGGIDTVKVCPPSVPDSCECPQFAR